MVNDSEQPNLGPSAPNTAEQMRHLRHELRTPVNHMVGYSEMLLEVADDLNYTDLRPSLEQLIATGKAILNVINLALNHSPSTGVHMDALYRNVTPHIEQLFIICDHIRTASEAQGISEFADDLTRIATSGQRLKELIIGQLTHALTATATTTTPPLPSATSPNGVLSGRLLLADDNELNRDMLARRLERLGYAVQVAEHGLAALNTLRNAPFDLLLLDLMMPIMDGYAVLGEMKNDPLLRHIPIIVLSALDEVESVVRSIEMGADDYLFKPFDPVLLNARISALLERKRLHDIESSYLQKIQQEKQRADDLLNIVIPIGVALSGERDFNQLLERILQEARRLCGADGGTLYLRTDDDRLKFVVARNDTLSIAMGGATGKDIPFAPVHLYDETTGQPNYNYVVTYTALTGKSINIPDAYAAEGYDFSGTRSFDQRTGYHSTSLLNVPLKDGSGRVIGVLQLLNALDRTTKQIIPFDAGMQSMLESLSDLAAAALGAYAREQRLRQEIAELRIEIDEARKKADVERITESDYFNAIQEKARTMRSTMQQVASNLQPTADPTADLPPAAGSKRNAKVIKEPAKQIFMVNGQAIHARVQGTNTKRIAIMIHGWSSSWYALSPLFPALSERMQCIAIDLPGYGESPPLNQRASIVAYADLIADLIRQVSDRPVTLIGHSMGGMTSITLSIRHPELVERMVLLGPTISGRLSRFINVFVLPITMLERFWLANRIVAALEPQLISLTDRLMRPASFAERTVIKAEAYNRLRADARRPGQGRVRAECFWAMRANNLSGKLGQITAPALVIWGMEDNTVPLRDASIVAEEWTSAELRVVPKAGHWPQFETPDITIRYIRAFLGTPLKLLKAQF